MTSNNQAHSFFCSQITRSAILSITLLLSWIAPVFAECEGPPADTLCGCRNPNTGAQVCISNELRCPSCEPGWRQRKCAEACSSLASKSQQERSTSQSGSTPSVSKSQRRAQQLQDASEVLSSLSGNECLVQQSQCNRTCAKNDYSCPSRCMQQANNCIDRSGKSEKVDDDD